MRSRTFEFILILFASSAVALLARYLADRGLVSENYVLPIYVIIVLIGGYLVIRIVNGILERAVKPTLGAHAPKESRTSSKCSP